MKGRVNVSEHISKINLSETQRHQLEKIVRKPSSPQNLVLRSQIILMTAAKRPVQEIEKTLRTTRTTIRKWKERYIESKLDGLIDKERPGHPAKYGDTMRLIIKSEADNPPPGRSKWTVRALAEHLGLNRGIIQRVLNNKKQSA